MLKESIKEYQIASSVITGYTVYYIITSLDKFSGHGLFLVLVLSILSYVYFESGTFGGLNNE